MADVRRTVTITEGRASCTITEADDGAVIVKASYCDGSNAPDGHMSLHVVAPDRETARRWVAAMFAALHDVIAGVGG